MTPAELEAQQNEQKRSAGRDLKADLKNLGYEYDVEVDVSKNEIIITSTDFENTDHRVRFLSFLRGKHHPTSGVCFAGLDKVRLRGGRFFAFSEAYPLNCFGWED